MPTELFGLPAGLSLGTATTFSSVALRTTTTMTALFFSVVGSAVVLWVIRGYEVFGRLGKLATTSAGSHRTVQIYTIIYIYDMIAYEWDEAKRLANLFEHKLDFEDAWRVYEATDKVTYQSLYPHEERWIDLAEVEGVVLLLVYTIRGETVRCISFRRARRGRERRLYHGQNR
jgi:uncharacterized DUF497 family protein